MKSFRRVIRRGLPAFLNKSFSAMVILTMLLQPVGTPGFLGVFSFYSGTAIAQETEPIEAEPAVEEEEAAPAEEAEPEEPTQEETAAEPVGGEEATEPVTTSAETEEALPAEEGAIDAKAAATEETTEGEENPETVCLGSHEEVKDSAESDWDVAEEGKVAETKEKVKLGVTYAFPGDKDVKVTFTCLPADESKLATLKIERISADDILLPDGGSVLGEYAYDITTDMDNGDFKYDMELPKSGDVSEARVSYVEKSAEEIKGSELTSSEVKEVDKEDTKIEENSIQAEGLDHFTTFFIIATYSSATFTVEKDTYLQGETVYVKATNFNEDEYYRLSINPPGNNNSFYIVACFNPASSNDTLTGTYILPANATISNDWQAELQEFDFSDCHYSQIFERANDNFSVVAPKPDLIAVKSHNPAGDVIEGQAFTWKIHIANTGTASALFSNGQTILTDNLPSSGATYGTPSVVNASGIAGTINCSIAANNLSCVASGAVNINAGGAFDVSFETTPTDNGSLKNPRNGQGTKCAVDPNDNVSEVTGTNNSCAETVNVDEYPYTEIDICHATESAGNPYIFESPNTAGVLMGHVGEGHQNGEDIIPPVPYYLPLGQNWDAEGQAIWDNDCKVEGKIKVIKVVDDETPLTQWSFALDNGAPKTASIQGVVEFDAVAPGEHTITESGPDGYALSSVTGCVQIPETLSAVATVSIGATTVCTFSNDVNKGSITIIKDAKPDSAQDFAFTTTEDLGGFSLDDDEDGVLSNTKTFSGLFPGQYAVTETETPGWNLAGIACVSANASLEAQDGNTANLTLHAGENIICTFTNEKAEFCGDGIVNNDETCDYGSLNGQSVCSRTCQFEAPVCEEEPTSVANGEFESPDVTNGAGWDIFDNAAVPAWSAAWYGGAGSFNGQDRPDPKIEIHGGVNGWTSGSDQYVELDTDWDGPSGSLNGEPASIALSQEMPTLIGKEYTVSWDYAARPGHSNNRLKVRVDGNEIFDSGVIAGGGSVDWLTKTYTFTATDTITEFTFIEAGNPDSLGMFLDNVRISCEEPVLVSDVKVCKLDQKTEEGLPGWTVLLKGEKLQDLAVPATVSTGVNSNPLFAGVSYIAKVSGTWLNQGGANPVDAEYSTTDGWATQMDGYTGYQNDILELQIDQAFDPASNWGAYNSAHVYAQSFTPTGDGPVNFRIFDGTGTSQNEGWFGDNSGSLAVDIFKGYAGITGQDGCVTFEDVPVGEYSVEEVLQDGWQYVSGQGEVTVDEEVETFNILNEKILQPDVQITKTDSPDPIVSGNVLTYTLTAKNNGPNSATGVVISDTLPANFSLQSVVPSVGACSDTTAPTIQCEVGTLVADATATVTIKGIALGVGVLSNTATVSNTNGDTNLDNNTDTEETAVNELLVACLNNTTYASSIIAFSQGLRKNNTPVLATRSIPGSVLGAPNATTGPDSGFYSLGKSGSLTVRFSEAITNVAGDDLSFHEITNGRNSYPLETANVEVSADGATWSVLSPSATSEPGGDGTVYLDISSALPAVSGVQYVRITDTTNFALNGDSLSDGYDIDAIDAKCGSGTVVVKKETNPESEALFSFDPSWSGDNFTLTDNGEKLFSLLSGNYSVSEALPLPEGWTQASVSCVSNNQDQESAENISLQPGETVTCTFTNNKEIKVVASKIVCTDEADLPNWGLGGDNISATTAQEWVNAHSGCDLVEGWNFQWSQDGVPNPGDNTGDIPSNWNDFGPTGVNGAVEVNIPGSGNSSRLWFREVWQGDYIPFSYGAHPDNSDNFSAEFYCDTDVLNYDNWEWIDTTPGGTYYCVAWNVLSRGQIIVEKETNLEGQEVPTEFEFDPSWGGEEGGNFFLSDGEKNDSGLLLPGTYSVEEVNLPEGWDLTNVSCNSSQGTRLPQVEVDNVQLLEVSENQISPDEIVLHPGEIITCTFTNTFEDPELSIQKTNSSFPTEENPGNTVAYTLKVKATGNFVNDVVLTDLPPEGFDVEEGTEEVSSSLGGSHVGSLDLSHPYASPGVWSLGKLAEGEEITITYNAKISNSQDSGIYDDLAYAKGTSGLGGNVLATDVDDADNFAGTLVAVATPVTDPTVKIDTDHEKDVDRDTKRKTEYVLGAATSLPATGANGGFLLLALLLLIGGIGLLAWSRRKSAKLVIVALALAGALVGGQASAASVAVEIETPDAVVSSPDFKIGFVTLDIQNRPLQVECFETIYGSFQTIDLIAGGSSGDCQINGSVMPIDGDYEFYVVANTGGEGESVESDHVSVKLVSTAPGTPHNYERDQATCDDKITFTTADDGGKTVKVELHRSTQKDFIADTPVATLDIGSNQDGNITVTPPDCQEDYWYALRAVDIYGNGSGFVGDEDVDVDTIHKTRTKTTKVTLPGAASGALAAGSEGSVPEEGVVEGATTAVGEGSSDEEGSVLGDETVNEGGLIDGSTQWAEEHPWFTALGILAAALLAYYVYRKKFLV